MPKRSNEFQRLIRTVYQQLVPEGAEVRESALLREEPGGAEREVDVLIEHEVADSKIRIAIETCDESRPASVGWIDELLGKYQRLRVDRVVAISRSGFSRTAREKALSNFIEPRTLEETLGSDWSRELIRIGAAKVIDRTRWNELGLITEPPLAVAPPLEEMVCNQEGADLISLGDLADQCFRQVVASKVQSETRSRFKVADDKKEISTEWTATPSLPLFLRDSDGKKSRILHLVFYAITSFSVEPLAVAHQSLGRAVISTATTELSEQEKIRFSLVQTPGKSVSRMIITNLAKPPSKKRSGADGLRKPINRRRSH